MNLQMVLTAEKSIYPSKIIRTFTICLMFIGLINLNELYAQKLYIFMPVEFSAIEIEKTFSKKMSKLTVRSFGKVADFKKGVSADKPDALITKPQLITQLEGYSICLKASFNGSIYEPYMLLSVEKPVVLSNISGKSIGVLDFLGNKEIGTFVVTMLKYQPVLTRVKKLTDLLPLLTMNIVEAAFVSESQFAYLKQRSNQNFIVTPCNCLSERAVFAMIHPDSRLIEIVKDMPEDLSQLLLIDAWKLYVK